MEGYLVMVEYIDRVYIHWKECYSKAIHGDIISNEKVWTHWNLENSYHESISLHHQEYGFIFFLLAANQRVHQQIRKATETRWKIHQGYS